MVPLEDILFDAIAGRLIYISVVVVALVVVSRRGKRLEYSHGVRIVSLVVKTLRIDLG